MPTAPFIDPNQVANPQGLLGNSQGGGVSPEHVLMAAANMQARGQLTDNSGTTGTMMPHRMKGPSQRHGGRVRSRAEGGDVEEGKAYRVGEHGPETFVPDQDGKIVPNKETPDDPHLPDIAKGFNPKAWDEWVKNAPYEGTIEDRRSNESLSDFQQKWLHFKDSLSKIMNLEDPKEQKSREASGLAKDLAAGLKDVGNITPRDLKKAEEARKAKEDEDLLAQWAKQDAMEKLAAGLRKKYPGAKRR